MSEFPFSRFNERREGEPAGEGAVPLPPIADFTWTVDAGNPRLYHFQDLSIDPDGQVVDWSYDFGDAPTVPTANFQVVEVTGLHIKLQNLSTDIAPGTIVSYLWNFGDNQTSTEENPEHDYSSAGSYPISLTVTDNDGNQSTKTITNSVSVTGTGRAIGPYNFYKGTDTIETLGTARCNLDHSYVSPANFAARVADARIRRIKLIITIPGNSHTPWITNGKFDIVKWRAGVDTFNIKSVRDAVAAGVADGTIIGNNTFDEPSHVSWGGVMTKALLDEMVSYIKTHGFATLPCGVCVTHWWRSGNGGSATMPRETFRVMDFYISQYDWWQGPWGPGSGSVGNTPLWRDAALSEAARQNMAIGFSMNIRNGSIQDITVPITWQCPTTGDPITQATGGFGDQSPNCRHTPEQTYYWGGLLLNAGAFLLMWKHDTVLFSRPAWVAKVSDLRTIGDSLAVKSVRRTA